MKNFTTQSISKFRKNCKISGSGNLDNIMINDYITKKIGNIDFALLFTYLFRRFGAPMMPGDSYKNLCQYYLSTPMKDVYLSVYPCASGYNFGVMYPSGTLQKIVWGNHVAVQAWHNRMRKWAKEKHNVTLFTNALGMLSPWTVGNGINKKMTKATAKLLSKEINIWLFSAYPSYAGPNVLVPKEKEGEIRKEFFEHKYDEFKKLRPEYEKIEKCPSWKSKEGDKLLSDILKAITATAKDLLSPVYIRDVCFNVLHNECDSKGYVSHKFPKNTHYADYFNYNTQVDVLNSFSKKKKK